MSKVGTILSSSKHVLRGNHTLMRCMTFLLPSSKFGNRLVYSNIKHNIVKLIIQNVQFAMLWVCKMKTTHAGILYS